MSDAYNKFNLTLKQAGYSTTVPRTVVFKTLANNQRLSIAELYKSCPTVDRATIYRTVALFEQLGIVQRIQQGWKYQLELSATYSHHHHHLICNHCGLIQEVHEDTALEARIVDLARQKKFTPHDHQIEIRGLCRTCQAKLSIAA